MLECHNYTVYPWHVLYTTYLITDEELNNLIKGASYASAPKVAPFKEDPIELAGLLEGDIWVPDQPQLLPNVWEGLVSNFKLPDYDISVGW